LASLPFPWFSPCIQCWDLYNYITHSFMFHERGISFIDVLVGTVIVLIVFLGIFGAFQLGLRVVAQSQNKISATVIANQWVEKIRNLPYGSIGTQGAVLPFVEGVLDSATTTFLNGTGYAVEIGVKYISDSADGTGAEDSCDLDYKRTEVKVSWSGRLTGEVKLVTDVAPKDKLQEIASCTAQPGGLLSISVFDAFGVMVSSPLIEVFDLEAEDLIDSYTPSSGRHDFPLVAANYKVVVSKAGYSMDRSYGTEEVATPEKPHPLVLEGEITETSFSIDRVSTFSIDTLSPWGRDYFSDSFQDDSQVSQSSSLVIGGGEVRLATNTEGYLSSGFLDSIGIQPASLSSWEELAFTDVEPLATELKYQLHYASGTEWYIIPEEDLAGNLAGFDISPVDLSGLSAFYSRLKIKGLFSSTDTTSTPALEDWQVSWITSQATPISNVTFSLRGDKVIGTDEEEEPVYKYSANPTSNSSGHIDISSLEWDAYVFSSNPASNLDLIETDPAPQPINLNPDTTISVDLFFQAENSLLLTVQDKDILVPIFSASTTLSNAGLEYQENQLTDETGQTHFIPLIAATYSLDIEAPGYLSTSTSVWVSGDVTESLKLEKVE